MTPKPSTQSFCHHIRHCEQVLLCGNPEFCTHNPGLLLGQQSHVLDAVLAKTMRGYYVRVLTRNDDSIESDIVVYNFAESIFSEYTL